MPGITLCCKLSGKSSRHRVEDVDFTSTVKFVREKIADIIKVDLHAFDLLYASQLLRDDKPLKCYGIQPGVTIFAIKKVHPAKEPSDPASYSLDRMSDEDDEPDGPPHPQQLPGRPPANEITANQLAAALAAAHSSTQPQPSTSSGAVGGVSLDFLQEAMLQAQSSLQTDSQGSSQSSSSSASSRPNLEVQLQQMRDMGITDESVARRALDAAGGNVQAALEFIFGDGTD